MWCYDQVMGKVPLDCGGGGSSIGCSGHSILKCFYVQNNFFSPFVFSLLCTIVVAEPSDINLKTV
jgi:hypothetical protein